MSDWLFGVISRDTTDPQEILLNRVKLKTWPLPRNVNFRKQLAQGDRIVFYVGHPHCSFAGTAVLDSEMIIVPPEEREKHSEGGRFSGEEVVRIKNTTVWKNMLPAGPMVPDLNFITNKEQWKSYLQGGIVRLGQNDFTKLVAAAGK